MVQDELVLVLQDAHLDSELHRHTRLALGYPLGGGLEEGGDFFLMPDNATLNHTPAT